MLREAPGNRVAWQILGSSSCYTGDAKGAAEAYHKLPGRMQKLLRTVCTRQNVPLPAE